jgi:transposase
MNIHSNARLTPLRREEMAQAVLTGRLSRAGAARAFGVSAKIVARWTERFRLEGRAGMQDRSSRPRRIPRQTAQALAAVRDDALRQRLCGDHIAGLTGVSPAKVSRILRRAGLSRLRGLAAPEPVLRHEYKAPGG